MSIFSLTVFISLLIALTILVARYEIKRSPVSILIDEYYKKIYESIILESIGDFSGHISAKKEADEIYMKIRDSSHITKGS